jgi:ketosteroid isomerase-like protein
MSKFLKTAALLLLTALCANTQAQTISEADQKGVEACYNGFVTAFEKLDPSGLGALLTENAEQIVPNGEITRGRNNVVASMAGYMEYLKTLPKPDAYDQKNVNWQSRYVTKDVIVSTYTEETTIQMGGKTTVEKQTNTIVLKKVGAQWLADLIAMTPVVDMPKQ